jgi:O-antigen ligase
MMAKRSIHRLLTDILWALLILLLPITSVPWIMHIFHTNAVAAPSVLVMLLILAIWFIPYLWKKGAFPYQSIPFLGFIGTALVSSLLAFFLPIPPFRDISLSSNELPAFLTLGIGACFYLVTACWASSPQRMKFLFRFVNWAGIALALWGSTQAYYSLFHASIYPAWMFQVQAVISNGTLYLSRISSFALEPSWLAHQLNLLFIPYWLGATLTGFSAHRKKLFSRISLENILLVLGIMMLFLSSSRIGLLAFLCCIGFLVLLGILWFYKWLSSRILARVRSSLKKPVRWLLPIASVMVLLVLIFGIFFGAGFFLSRTDWRMATLFNFQTYASTNWFDIANQMVFAERIVYWQVGMRVFNSYPLLGVGLGNTGYFFPQFVYQYGLNLPEVQNIINRDLSIPNAKNLWVRVLSETGIVGFAFFASWLVILWISAVQISRSGERILKTISWMGRLAIVAYFIEGLSIDTFGLPYIWISLGLVTAGWSYQPFFSKAASAKASRT